MQAFKVLSAFMVAFVFNGFAVAQTESNGVFSQEVVKATVPFKALGLFSSEKQVEVTGVLLTLTDDTKRPYPLVIFNHGSQDGGTTLNHSVMPITLHLLSQGVAVFIPARKGFNLKFHEKSSVTADSSEPGDCRSQPLSEFGLKSAKQDVTALFEALKAKKFDYLNTDKVVLAGSSRGGFLSLELAADKLPGVVGVVNFSGGWSSEPCPGNSAFFNTKKFKEFGEKIDVPVVSFYGDRDSYYSTQYVDGFLQLLSVNKKAVGQILPGQNHSGGINSPAIWSAKVMELLK